MYVYHILSLLFMFRALTDNRRIPLLFKLKATNIDLYRKKEYEPLLITKSNNKTYQKYEIEKWFSNSTINSKKLITLSPGGYKGFYMLGIVRFLKKNYNLSEYIFSGASAGAWNSLMLAFKHDIEVFKYHIMDDAIQNAKSIAETEQVLKSRLLKYYRTEDFDLAKLFIGVTSIKNNKPHTIIYTQFETLEDAIDCCIASSHIPLVTGNMTHMYNNMLSFDGGFSKYPYFNISRPVLHITPSIWAKQKPGIVTNIQGYTTLFSKDKFNFTEICETGYNDSHKNKDILDKIFIF
jgi:hypothetical protein